MLPIEIKPKGRRKKDKQTYLFMRWWIKQNRKEIESKIKKAYLDYFLYGIQGENKEE